jgi:ABC-type multidrug transport system ATPase subunit
MLLLEHVLLDKSQDMFMKFFMLSIFEMYGTFLLRCLAKANAYKVVMAMYGISHTIDTRVGNDFVRGVSGGERKRVTIAEATLSFAPLQCWDNSTRGMYDLTIL